MLRKGRRGPKPMPLSLSGPWLLCAQPVSATQLHRATFDVRRSLVMEHFAIHDPLKSLAAVTWVTASAPPFSRKGCSSRCFRRHKSGLALPIPTIVKPSAIGHWVSSGKWSGAQRIIQTRNGFLRQSRLLAAPATMCPGASARWPCNQLQSL